MEKQLSVQDALRYNRQILMPGFDLERQEKLLNSRILMLGAGGLGCACSQYLAASGVGHLTVVDDDIVEISNLQRQILHYESDLKRKKSESAKDSLQTINKTIDVTAISERVTGNELTVLVTNHDIVIDCTDNLSSRNELNRIAFATKTPLVSAAAIRMEGNITCFDPNVPESPCYQCISQFFGEQTLSCVESGILAPVVGIMGVMQALETIKILTNFGKPAVGKLLLFDAMTLEWQEFKLHKQAGCPDCGCN